MSHKKVWFVSGIDTDAGKSYATAELARRRREEGERVITQKFIQTGMVDQMTGVRRTVSEDIELHRQIMGLPLLPEDMDGTTCPIALSYPASPDLAARIDGTQIDLSLVERSTARLLELYDTVLIEGAGGLMVPIQGLYTTVDYVAEKRLPLILVTNPKLGSVNHTMLSLEVCRKRGIEVSMVLYNHHPQTSAEITADTRQTILDYLALYHPQCEFIEIPYIKL